MKKYAEYIYLLAVFLSPITPIFDSADVVAPQFISLTCATLIGIVLLLVNKTKTVKLELFSTPLYLFSTYLVVASASSFFAINKVESIIALTKIFIVFVNIYIIYSLNLYKKISFSNILVVSTIYLLIESLRSIYPITPILDFSGSFDFGFASEYMKGFTGNKNIAAASIAIKIPLALILLHKSKKTSLITLSIISLFVSITTLLFLGARASFLSIIFIVLISLIFHLYYFKKQKKIIFNFKHIAVIVSILVGYSFFANNIQENSKSSIENRMNFVTADELDNSSKIRLRYYKQAIEYSLDNIIIGAGIGNWKLVSIDLDKENMRSYIVPYNLHNDFLEILGETGIFGFISYVGFFIVLFYFLLKSLKYGNSIEDNRFLVLLIAALICYIVDASFNFPQYRVVMQVNLLLLMFSILAYTHNKLKISNEE